MFNVRNFGSVIGGLGLASVGQQFSASGAVVVNGKSYSGRSVTIVNNKVYVDGKEADGGDLSGSAAKTIDVVIQGDATAPVSVTQGTIKVKGSATQVSSTSGDIDIGGGVSGGVNTVSGRITVGRDVTGDVQSTSGGIRIEGYAHGQATSTVGTVKRRKPVRNGTMDDE